MEQLDDETRFLAILEIATRTRPTEDGMLALDARRAIQMIAGIPPSPVGESQFGYVELPGGGVGWAGVNPPDGGAGWAAMSDGPKGGKFWKRVEQEKPLPATIEASGETPWWADQQEQPQQPEAAPKKGDVQQATKAPMHPLAQPVAQMMEQALASNSKLDPVQKAKYQAATDNVLRAMPEGALKRVGANIKKVSLYSSVDELTANLAVKGGSQMKAKIEGGLRAAGSFTPGSGHWRADGDVRQKDNLADKRTNVHEAYAHEFGHAIDGPGLQLSNTKEWQTAYYGELARGNLSEYAKTSAAEGFAEFSRAVYGGAAKEETLEQFFPQSVAFFRSQGLMHGPADPKTPKQLKQAAPLMSQPHETTAAIHGLVELSGWDSVDVEGEDSDEPPEGSRLDVLGKEGRVKFNDPLHGLSDQELLAHVAGKQPLPVPAGGENGGDRFLKAWADVSVMLPEAAAAIKKVTVLTGEQLKNWSPGGIMTPTMAVNPKSGELVVGTPEGVEPGILWHELVHVEQHLRGDFLKEPRAVAGKLTAHGRLLESECHQRGNVQGEKLVARLRDLTGRGKRPSPQKSDEPPAAKGWG